MSRKRILKNAYLWNSEFLIFRQQNILLIFSLPKNYYFICFMNILNIIYMKAYCILVVVVVLIIFLTVTTNKKGPKSVGFPWQRNWYRNKQRCTLICQSSYEFKFYIEELAGSLLTHELYLGTHEGATL